MKKINTYWINDGDDGIIVAKSLKHCIKLMLKNGYGSMKQELINMKNDEDLMTMKEWENHDGFIYEVAKRPKNKKYYKKSMFVGWIQ